MRREKSSCFRRKNGWFLVNPRRLLKRQNTAKKNPRQPHCETTGNHEGENRGLLQVPLRRNAVCFGVPKKVHLRRVMQSSAPALHRVYHTASAQQNQPGLHTQKCVLPIFPAQIHGKYKKFAPTVDANFLCADVAVRSLQGCRGIVLKAKRGVWKDSRKQGRGIPLRVYKNALMPSHQCAEGR